MRIAVKIIYFSNKFTNKKDENFKFKLSKYRIAKKIWNFPENITLELKNEIKSNISSLVQESLELSENYETISSEKMKILEQKFNFHEDSLSYLPKFMNAYFSEQSSTVNALESILEEKKYSKYLKIIEESPIFSSISNPFSNKKYSNQNSMDSGPGDIVIFSKTFYICQEYEDIYQGEAFQLKNLYLIS